MFISCIVVQILLIVFRTALPLVRLVRGYCWQAGLHVVTEVSVKLQQLESACCRSKLARENLLVFVKHHGIDLAV